MKGHAIRLWQHSPQLGSSRSDHLTCGSHFGYRSEVEDTVRPVRAVAVGRRETSECRTSMDGEGPHFDIAPPEPAPTSPERPHGRVHCLLPLGSCSRGLCKERLVRGRIAFLISAVMAPGERNPARRWLRVPGPFPCAGGTEEGFRCRLVPSLTQQPIS